MHGTGIESLQRGSCVSQTFWLMPVIKGGWGRIFLQVWGQSELHSEFWANLDNKVRACLSSLYPEIKMHIFRRGCTPIQNGIYRTVLILLCWSVCPAWVTSELPAFPDFGSVESFEQVFVPTLWQVLAREMERRGWFFCLFLKHCWELSTDWGLVARNEGTRVPELPEGLCSLIGLTM